MVEEKRRAQRPEPDSSERSSMGRGVDVLFGEGGSRPALARRAMPAGALTSSGNRQSPPTDAALEDMLYDEARAMLSGDEGSAREDQTPPVVQSRGYEPPRRSTRPPAIAPRTSTSSSSSQPKSVRIGGIVMDVPGDALSSIVPPGPGEQITPEIVIEPRDYTPEERARILADDNLQQRLQTLMAEVDDLYEIGASELAVHPQHSGTVLKLLHEARTTLLERPYAFADAELKLNAARTLARRTADSRQTARRNWPWLFAYELIWAILLLGGLIFEGAIGNWIAGLGLVAASSMEEIFPAWGSMMAGGIGGVVCAIWSMWYHMSDQQDYDPQHNIWYLVQPLQGMVLGIIVYLVFAAGFLAMQTDISGPDVSKAAKYLPWMVAAIAGLRQTFVYELLDRIVGLLTPGGKSS